MKLVKPDTDTPSCIKSKHDMLRIWNTDMGGIKKISVHPEWKGLHESTVYPYNELGVHRDGKTV